MKRRDLVTNALYVPVVASRERQKQGALDMNTSAQDSIVELARMLGCIPTKGAITEAIDRLFASVPVISPKATKPLITASELRAAKDAGCTQFDFLAAKKAIAGNNTSRSKARRSRVMPKK
jgi:hypothetical protein